MMEHLPDGGTQVWEPDAAVVRTPLWCVFSPTEASAPQPCSSARAKWSSAVAPSLTERAASLSQRSPSAPVPQLPITLSRAKGPFITVLISAAGD